MTKSVLTVVGCALLWAATAVATPPTPQEKCDKTRVTAWKAYVSCVDTVVAKEASCVPTVSCPANFNEFTAFAKCRHAYFKKWKAIQGTAFVGSTCAAGLTNRFTVTDSGATVTDGLTGLVWELKDNLDNTPNYADPHDADNYYTWSTGSNNEDGTAFTTFLTAGLNTPGFAGANGWRLPTLAELQSIVLDFACTSSMCSCGTRPCIDGTFGPTQADYYWSATSYVPNPNNARNVTFFVGDLDHEWGKTSTFPVRAVRGGL